MHEFEFDPAAQPAPRCQPGRGIVIAIMGGIAFCVGVAGGVAIGWAVF